MLRLLRPVRPSAAAHLGAEDELLPLAEAAAEGDAVALRTLLTAVGPQILRVVRRVLGPEHVDVEDVVQECAVDLVHALRRFRRESSVMHFACRVALHSAMNARRRLRAAKRGPEGGERVEADRTVSPRNAPDVELLVQASVDLVRRLCSELPEAQSEVLALHCLLGYTMAEVASICDAPLETVRTRLRTAKLALSARALADPRLRELLEATA
jgi:RNA polymerase sigma factor (sigma-70 family)